MQYVYTLRRHNDKALCLVFNKREAFRLAKKHQCDILAIEKRVYNEGKSQTFGWDWPTLLSLSDVIYLHG